LADGSNSTETVYDFLEVRNTIEKKKSV
jgi:hypothetical protein